jgi:transcriptional regulator with XRE-family HTH domain
MLNAEDFIKRLEFILDNYGMNASIFADKIGVQRSSISHLLSGRNKPSLDFIMKILDLYPELDLYWLLNGTGFYLKRDDIKIVSNDSKKLFSPTADKIEDGVKKKHENKVDENNISSLSEIPLQLSKSKQLDKIVFFFTDGTFQDFNPTDSK